MAIEDYAGDQNGDIDPEEAHIMFRLQNNQECNLQDYVYFALSIFCEVSLKLCATMRFMRSCF